MNEPNSFLENSIQKESEEYLKQKKYMKQNDNYKISITFEVRAKNDFEAYEAVKNWWETIEPFNGNPCDIEVNQ